MQQSDLKDLYIDELKDIYSAETQLVKALPKMAKAAASEELRSGFEEHLEQTKGHVARLEQIFQALEEKPTGKKCMGMEGLIKEGGTVRAMAEQLGENEAMDLLSQTLQEEKDTDVKLSNLADQIQVVSDSGDKEEDEAPARTAKAKAARA